MKTTSFLSVARRCRAGLAFLITLAIAPAVTAQTSTGNSTVPTVSLWATDPIASVSGQTGTFTVVRQGDTNLTLNVYYEIGGTASNGVDYAPLSNWVTIPAGAITNYITIAPVNAGQSNVSTVVLQLAPSPLLNPVNYVIGSPSNATVYIEGNGVTNLPPVVNISQPANGETFTAPASFFILAPAGDLDGYVKTVAFYAGTNYLSTFNVPPPPPPGGPVPAIVIIPQYYWTNVPAGKYVLTAVATDNGGASATSAPVNITVLASPPPTNPPPVVAIISPTNGETFTAPASIEILAKASDTNGSVTNVEFYAGANDLGHGSVVVLDPPGVGGVTGPVYFLNWLNPPPGNVPLTAVATDNQGASTTSLPVKITITQGPPTNPPPVVRIISPASGAMFRAPVNLPLYAYAQEANGPVASVAFYAGTNLLGAGVPVPRPLPTPLTPLPGPPGPAVFSTNVYVLVWSNAPAGNYDLTAVAVDNAGITVTSAPVNITILVPIPPPVSRPPVVSIVATDPVAVEGTNIWVWPGMTDAVPTWTAWPTATLCWHTNAGPKTATFTVFRAGETTNNLAVTYAIGGTATNGVDYVTLPGIVTVPAGGHSALITVVPIDDGPPDLNKTVVLTLTPATNSPPAYTVGFPSRAAALIIDSDGPRPVTGMLPDHSFHLCASGPDAAWYCLESSTNLTDWTPVCTNQVVHGSIDFVDPDASAHPTRFYRTIPLTNTPTD